MLPTGSLETARRVDDASRTTGAVPRSEGTEDARGTGDAQGADEPPGAHRRDDIQGLRAVAVLVVIAFHGGLPVPGGFTGVDVFFVVSGFVIAGMLRREVAETGRIGLREFSRRRFARLTPALAVAVTTTVLVGAMALSPYGDQQNLAVTAIGAMLLTANVAIIRTTGDYFDLPADRNALLHTWSLSVEEQFYLLFPLLLAAAWWWSARTGRRSIPGMLLAVVGLVSLAGSLVASAGSSSGPVGQLFGFYGPGARAWEFVAGALLALVGPRAVGSRTAIAAGIVGVVGLVVSMWAISEHTPFPGPWTLVPVGATVLLLVAGQQRGAFTTRLLSLRPLVHVGDRSYSLYLWHWPVIVLAKQAWPASPGAVTAAAFVSVLPAIASYRWVEQPLRRSLRVVRGRGLALAVATIVGVPVAIAAGTAFAADHVWKPRYESGAFPARYEGELGNEGFLRWVARSSYPCEPGATGGPLLADPGDGSVGCRQSRPGAGRDVVVLGDSHAHHLYPGLATLLPDRTVAVDAVGALPVRGSVEVDAVLDRLVADPGIEVVVVSAYWRLRGVPVGPLRSTLRELAAAGKQVLVTDDVPTFPFDPFRCKYRTLLLPSRCAVAASTVAADRAPWFPALRAAVAGIDGVRLVPTASALCDRSRCSMARDGRLLYRDGDHLNRNGSRLVARVLLADPAFARAVGARP